MAGDFEQGAAFDLAGVLQAENAGKGPVGEENALALANHGHAFDHASENGRGAVALVGQDADAGVQSRGALIQRARQPFELVAARLSDYRAKIERGHAAREFTQGADSPGEIMGVDEGDEDGRGQ